MFCFVISGLLELGDIIEIKAAVVQYYVIYVGMDAEIGHLVAYRWVFVDGTLGYHLCRGL
jgi:hypothetical protein